VNPVLMREERVLRQRDSRYDAAAIFHFADLVAPDAISHHRHGRPGGEDGAAYPGGGKVEIGQESRLRQEAIAEYGGVRAADRPHDAPAIRRQPSVARRTVRPRNVIVAEQGGPGVKSPDTQFVPPPPPKP